ncbi:hypothetical protein APUTEX25_000829 [Auxenochlorella protothecoides]|uniref:ubiquitinyl hydrolase 1 n=1 Tax=Auxenochlorella protothecoides TaxID=3075 RepID=A0A3M7KSF7_AUXPR|nr:hypothetical protein APUTEX25_000829 [Auxenochlorella protothecoides]|eukprot:RMZ52710.1 hypothetical protein APUTEX25_000829 [Auxenochlorella protothecoides]
MGASNSKLDKVILELPDDERYFGLENFGNTCYANSVLQTLYFCRPFRDRVLRYAAENPPGYGNENLLTCLADLFLQTSSQKKKTGFLSPRRLINRIKSENALFSNFMHQDAHEFLNYLLNDVSEILAREQKAAASAPTTPKSILTFGRGKDGRSPSLQELAAASTAITSREEDMFDLSLEIEPNCSVTSCLKKFSATEVLDGADKFFCDQCNSLQEAQKFMRMRHLPQVLCLHLKRFKYNEQLGRLSKLSHRVVFPFELKVVNTTPDCPDADTSYDLFGVVVHMGAQPNHGHYVALVKSCGQWVCFDDDQVIAVTEAQVQSTFGQPYDGGLVGSSNGVGVDHGYILLYQRNSPASEAPLPMDELP